MGKVYDAEVRTNLTLGERPKGSVGLAEAFDFFAVEEFMGFFEDGGDFGGEGALADGFCDGGAIPVGGVFAGEPVAGVAEEIVAHFAEFDHVEGLGE